jgi:DNA polymerase I
MTTPPTISDYKEIWAIDFEFYPGPGLANGGREGDLPTPLCLVAIEIRTGRVIHQWCDEFRSTPPYRIDSGALIVSYMSTAEFSCHLALGWPQPACTFDAYVEFRHLTNDGSAKGREKGFYSLPGALQYFGENGIDTAHKTDMRGRIVQGPPFSADEREAIQKYCEDDVRALVRVFKYIAPTVRSWPHALIPMPSHVGRSARGAARYSARPSDAAAPARELERHSARARHPERSTFWHL